MNLNADDVDNDGTGNGCYFVVGDDDDDGSCGVGQNSTRKLSPLVTDLSEIKKNIQEGKIIT